MFSLSRKLTLPISTFLSLSFAAVMKQIFPCVGLVKYPLSDYYVNKKKVNLNFQVWLIRLALSLVNSTLKQCWRCCKYGPCFKAERSRLESLSLKLQV